MNYWISLVVFLAMACGVFAVDLSFPVNTTQFITSGVGEKLIAVNCAGDRSGIKLEAQLRTYGHRDVVQRITVDAMAAAELKFDVKKIGFYDVTVTAKRGKETVARIDANLAVVPEANYERPQDMGVCVHFMQGKHPLPMEETLSLLKLAGFTRLRDDVSWQSIEREPRVYGLPERFIEVIGKTPEFGITPLFVIGYNNPIYREHFTKSFPTTPEMYEAFGNAAAYVAAETKGKVDEWEIWNEPNYAHPANEYLPLLKVVYGKIKAANPDAVVISCGGSGAGGGPGGGAIVPIVKAGGLEFQDAFSIHPYMSPSEPDFGYRGGPPLARVSIPEFTGYLGRFIDGNLKADGSRLGLYVTEIGWCLEHPAALQIPVTEVTQAAFLARTYLLFRAQNRAAGVYWYDFQNDGAESYEKEHNFGLIKLDHMPKPAYQAAATVASMLRNREFKNAIQDGRMVKGDANALKDATAKIYVYGEPGSRMVAAWFAPQQNSGCTMEWVLPFAYENAKFYDWQGTELAKPEKLDGNKIVLDLNHLPKYITEE